ncbi:MAG TPA: hemolysin family protein [Tepidisphaeraceae bacterium]|nr:hemolysin family protein [Tepidisphaeraceae bacterium]
MTIALTLIAAILASTGASILNYSIRDFSRARLADYLERRGRSRLYEPLLRGAADIVFATATIRVVANVLILLALLRAFDGYWHHWYAHYIWAAVVTVAITIFCSVAVPHAVSQHAAEPIVGLFAEVLLGLRILFLPLAKILHGVDRLVVRMAGGKRDTDAGEIEQEILSVVAEGEKEGIVDKVEREMIVSVIEFRDTQVGQIMTARPEIVALEVKATLDEVKRTLEESGHSRIPVYEGTLDHVLGILYARDLLKHLGQDSSQFSVRPAMRPAVFVPETKPLRDLLKDFRVQKVHIAIVADEYGGTAGLVTIEDILEELVGEISDEHEPAGPSSIRRIDERTAEVDARMYLGDFNRHMKLKIPDDAGYETVGGFVSVTLGRIPPVGTTFDQDGVRYTIVAAEPQRVDRVRVEVLPPQPLDYKGPANNGEGSKEES